MHDLHFSSFHRLDRRQFRVKLKYALYRQILMGIGLSELRISTSYISIVIMQSTYGENISILIFMLSLLSLPLILSLHIKHYSPYFFYHRSKFIKPYSTTTSPPPIFIKLKPTSITFIIVMLCYIKEDLCALNITNFSSPNIPPIPPH